ncbi:peptide deformylase [Rhodobacteraceae bacterium]|nr:peptide deformylase [Paracoccaceae bacterium]
MARLIIRQYPDPILRKLCEPVDHTDPSIQKLARDMLDTMYHAQGRGLAAPQVGIPIQLFVMDPNWKNGTQTPYICANPDISALDDTTRKCEEVCLSIPDRPVMVTRPARVMLRWRDAEDQTFGHELTGDAAIIAQHEADHLKGRLCIDYENSAP